ncbi:MAG: SET domain-containing protein-lysine N-methyltransferase [Patescibacteria group bacterium]
MRKGVEIKEAEKKGKGVFALRNFRKGEVVFVNYRGRSVKERDLEKILKSEGDHLNEIDRETWEIMNPPGRFVNHSCNPNAIPKESSKKKVPYFALKSIKKGEEITVDYRINAHTGNTWKCNCGNKNCSGKVTSDFFTLSESLQKKYLPYSSKFIKNEYVRRHIVLRTEE